VASALDNQRLVRDSTAIAATTESPSIPISSLPSSPTATAGTRRRFATHRPARPSADSQDTASRAPSPGR
jgi:hypothetical protein